MAAIMAVGIHTTAFAETLQGGSDWKVEFDGSKMSSNFTSADMKKDIFRLQPGDTMELQVGLKNTSEKDADWYMTNEVLKSLEDSQSIAEGGAYGYRLTYVGPDKKETVLYDSETVGGEDAKKGEGLHQATDALNQYLYLDRLSKGDVASVHLTVKLDGETQGNDYQDTLASLQIRISGRDNNAAVENSSFEVTGDQEYVVAYGIKGNQVAYTINYQDANGNKLADSQTFYGNVGDKPVVAYTYIDGYTPEYRNLTKTLSANAAENVFTFNYLPYETVTVTTPGQTITNTTGQTVTVPGGTTTTTGGTAGGTTGTTSGTGTNANGGNAAGTTTGNGDAQGTDATGGTGNGGPGNGTDDQATAGTDNAGTNQDAQGNEDTTTIGDEETPKADQDLKDLDDEDVPKSDKDLDGNKKVKKSLPLVAGVGIGVAALAALAATIVIVRKRVHR